MLLLIYIWIICILIIKFFYIYLLGLKIIYEKNDYFFKVNKKVFDIKFLRNVRKYIYIINKYI